MTGRIFMLIAFSIALSACNKQQLINPPVNLKCENVTNPINIDIQNPVFGWQFSDSSYGVKQVGYQLIVAREKDLLEPEKADMWNSGKVMTNVSQYIKYAGKELKSASTYYWAVQLLDSLGNGLGFSEPAIFETGMLKTEDWKANLIKVPSKSNSALVRNQFELTKKFSSARLYISGLGAYITYINGKRVGNDYLAPGWSVFEKHVPYQVYNVDSFLVSGKNVIGTILANVWPDNKFGLVFISVLKISYEDGTTDWISTGNNWEYHESPVIACSFEEGERFDASKQIDGWDRVGSNKNGWQKVERSNLKLNFNSFLSQPVVVKKEIKPQNFYKEKDAIICDFGETLPGWIKIKSSGPSKKIVIKYLQTYDIKSKTEGKPEGKDEVINLDENKFWEPLFSYHTFRYVSITGISQETSKDEITAVVAYPDVAEIGNFSCSSKLINRINNMIVRSGRNNILTMLSGLPTDESKECSPVNTYVFASAALFNFNLKRSFENYITSLTDYQGKNGHFHLPSAKYAGWGDVIVHLPWRTYVSTGDKRILENNIAKIKLWHDSQQRESDAMSPPYMHNVEGNGDLYSLAETTIPPFSSAYYFYSTSVLSNISEALGNQDDAIAYMELAGFTKDQFNQSYLTYKLAKYWSNTQTAHLLPLAVGLTPISHAQKVADFIAKDVIENGVHPTTGILTTQFLLPILSAYNHNDVVYRLITQTSKPSIGYMVNKGSSTIWNSWDGNDAFNYQLAFASVGDWFYTNLAGINPDPKFPGYKHTIIDPNPVGDLKWVKASINTLYGLLLVKWEIVDNSMKINVRIPANTWSTLMLPVKDETKATVYFNDQIIIKDGKTTNNLPSHILLKGFDSKMVVLDIESGSYTFMVK